MPALRSPRLLFPVLMVATLAWQAGCGGQGGYCAQVAAQLNPSASYASATVADGTPPAPHRIVLDQAMLHFADDSAVLPEAGAAAVRRVAGTLKAFPGTYRILVSGHTSGTGRRLHNLALSLQRAEAVARVLREEGLPADRIRTAGFGPDQPIESNATPEGRARNRRVEIEVQAAGAELRRTETALQD